MTEPDKPPVSDLKRRVEEARVYADLLERLDAEIIERLDADAARMRRVLRHKETALPEGRADQPRDVDGSV